jgi:hypothetical protein
MKKLWLVALGIAFLAVAPAALAQSGGFEGFDYTVNSDDTNTVRIIGYTGPGGVVNIPTMIVGRLVTIIGQNAFGPSFGQDQTLTSVTIPGSVTTIGDGAFSSCTLLTSVAIPTSVTNIGVQPFANCTSLTAIILNDAYYNSVDGVLFDKSGKTLIEYPAGLAGSYVIPSGVTSISDSAFANCPSLTSVTIPGTVTNIGAQAFWVSGLTSVTFLNGVSSIGTDAFERCALTQVTIPGSIKTIESGAFEDCYGLVDVTLSNGLVTLGSDAFENCPLASLTIPGSVTNLMAGALVNCENLANIYFTGNAPQQYNNVFVGTAAGATVYYLPNTKGWGASFDGLPTKPYAGYAIKTGSLPAAAGGMATGSGSYGSGTKVTVTASTTNDCYAFVDWTSAGKEVSTNAGYQFTVTNNETLTANFAQLQYAISTSSSPAADGSATGGGKIKCGGDATLKATAKSGFLFSGWTSSLGGSYSNANIKISVGADEDFTAHFVVNPFLLGGKGTYNGLFAAADEPRAQSNSGAFTFTVTSTGGLTGKLTIGSATPSLNGLLDPTGAATIITARKGLPSLTTTLQLDFANQSVQGTVADGSFTASLAGNQEVFSSAHKATNYEGHYTFIIPGVDNPNVGPFGASYGTATVTASGTITYAGSLADGTAFGPQTGVVSKDGLWPFYLSLYGSNGSLWSWINLGAVISSTNASWISVTNTAKSALYRSGFTNSEAAISGSLYTPTNLPLLNLTSAQVILQEGSWTATITNQITWSANNTIKLTPDQANTNKLELTINKTTGVINGSFANPSNPKETITLNGVLLQNQTNAQGYFRGTNQSGAFTLMAQ